MAALDTTARHKGHKAMEERISTAARVRRQLKVGRPRTGSLTLNAYEALGILEHQTQRAEALMRAEGLNPGDVKLRLIIRLNTGMLLKTMPSPPEAQAFFELVSGAAFLGILWEQTDRDVTEGQPGVTYWVTPFVTEPQAKGQMLALLEFIKAGGTQVLAN